MRPYQLLLVVLIVTAGCSRGGEPRVEPRYDPEQARTALIEALDAWKKGEAKSLSKRNPPIRFVDDDLLVGLRLSDYEVEEPDLPLKPHQNVSVILSLRDARGKSVRREASYQVGTEPTLTVLRSDH